MLSCCFVDLTLSATEFIVSSPNLWLKIILIRVVQALAVNLLLGKLSPEYLWEDLGFGQMTNKDRKK